MATCIICHLGIIEGVDSIRDCPNGHSAHSDCLKEWLLHSSKCPLCRGPYSKEVLDIFKDFIKLREDEKLKTLNNELKEEELKKMEVVASKMTFLKFIESIKQSDVEILGLSALLTIAIDSVKEIVTLLEKENLRNKIKIIVGGSAFTEDLAKNLGVDAYGKDPMDALKKCQKFLKNP